MVIKIRTINVINYIVNYIFDNYSNSTLLDPFLRLGKNRIEKNTQQAHLLTNWIQIRNGGTVEIEYPKVRQDSQRFEVRYVGIGEVEGFQVR